MKKSYRYENNNEAVKQANCFEIFNFSNLRETFMLMTKSIDFFKKNPSTIDNQERLLVSLFLPQMSSFCSKFGRKIKVVGKQYSIKN